MLCDNAGHCLERGHVGGTSGAHALGFCGGIDCNKYYIGLSNASGNICREE